jgi:hypothetical protein
MKKATRQLPHFGEQAGNFGVEGKVVAGAWSGHYDIRIRASARREGRRVTHWSMTCRWRCGGLRRICAIRGQAVVGTKYRTPS